MPGQLSSPSGTLQPLGTIQYVLSGDPSDQFTFNSTTETTAYSVTPIYDAAGRTVVYSNIDITLRTYIDADDPSLNTAIAVLQKPAGTLIIEGHGLGYWPVNLLTFRDVVWGPKPQIVSQKVVGSDKVTELTWRVQFGVMTCADGLSVGELMEWCFTLGFSIDRTGYTTRKYSGHARIPQTRKTAFTRTLADTVDNYREQIVPPLITGFRRVSQNYELSYDKCRIDFTIVDEQMGPNALPVKIIEADASHGYSTVGTPAGARWLFHLEATYELMQGYTADNAIAAFSAMLTDRLNDARRMVKKAGLVGAGFPLAPGGPVAGDTLIPIPWGFSVSEPTIFGHTKAKFSAAYLISGCGLSEIFRTGGLWNPVPKLGGAGFGITSPDDWLRYVYYGFAGGTPPLGPRGYLGLKMRLSDDGIVDLCGSNPSVTVASPPNKYVSSTPGPGPGSSSGSTGFPPGYAPPTNPPANQLYQQQLQQVVPVPNAQQSWIWFENDPIIYPRDMGVVVGRTLPQSPLTPSQVTSQSQQAWNVMAGVEAVGNGQNTNPFPPAARVMAQDPGATFVQQRCSPELCVSIVGSALRAGYTIPVPELVQFAGLNPIYIGGPSDFFTQSIVKNAGIPIVNAQWKLTYLLSGPGTGPMPITSNPALA